MSDREVFRLTGRVGGALRPLDGVRLRPAAFARYGDLTVLRGDYPVVLVDGPADGVRTLTAVVNDALRRIAPRGPDGERTRRAALRVERQIRRSVAAGSGGRLRALWQRESGELAQRADAALRKDLDAAQAALDVDGELVGCRADAAARVVTHLWLTSNAARGSEMRAVIDRLVSRLEDLVRADRLRSDEGRTAEGLAVAVGATHRALFDFDAMARLLAAPSGHTAMRPERRARIGAVLETLRTQRFFHPDTEPLSFVFDELETAVATYRRRLPEVAAVTRAIAVAELEVQGNYVEAAHDAYFARFDERSLSPEDLSRFPDYLVRIGEPAGRAEIIGALSSGLPLKILLTTSRLLEAGLAPDPAPALGAQIGTTVMGLGDVFVVQVPASALPRMGDAITRSIAYRGPTLVSVFSGAVADAALPPYLVSAAAHASRAFPAFTYDPGAGADWSSRFALGPNPQPSATWPEHVVRWSDAALRRASATVPFTFLDYALCDPGQAERFALLPDGERDDALLALDDDARLHGVIADERLHRGARRCADAWERLRELDALKRPLVASAPAAVETPTPPAAPAPPPVVERAEAPATDEAYIETPRCTTCNECTAVNPRMFAYNENKQAYIKDASAGTFRQLVEAAESCQMAIIHPGKPRDPGEPGLEELVARAEAFR